VRANCHLNVQATVRNCARFGRLFLLSPRGRDGRVSASEGKGVGLGEGEGEGRGRDLLQQTTRDALEPLTSRLRSAAAGSPLPFPSGEATERASGIKPEMNLTT
jgi:hypothetical protein